MDRNFCLSGSLFGITRHSLVMPNGDPRDENFCPYLTAIEDTYILTVCKKHRTSADHRAPREDSDQDVQTDHSLLGHDFVVPQLMYRLSWQDFL